MAALVRCVALMGLMLAWPAAASAGVLTIDGDVLTYTGDPGEVNSVQFYGGLRDSTAEMRYGPGCNPPPGESPETARVPRGEAGWCYGSYPQRTRLRLGDQNDAVVLHETPYSLGEIDTGSGDDYVEATVAPFVNGGDGDDTLLTGWSRETHGGEGNDRIAGAGTLDGGPGNDRIEAGGWGNPHHLDGGEGDDLITGEPEGVASAHGGPGDDTIDMAVAGGTLAGDEGNDRITSWGGGAPDIEGGPGRDTLTGPRRVAGGPDDDVVTLTAPANDALPPPPGPGACAPEPAVWPAVPWRVGTGDDGDDVIIGSDRADRLDGGDGNDRLAAGGGGDALIGGAGDDVLEAGGNGQRGVGAGGDLMDGGPGSDRLVGTDGWDTACYGDRRAGVIVDLRTPGGDGEPGEGDDLSGIDAVIGSDTSDVITAGLAPLRVDGRAGNDVVTGGPAPDDLRGGPGSDSLDGGPGDDRIAGDDGDDRVRGSDGADQLGGDEGDDRIEGDAGRDTLRGGNGDDWISGGDDEDLLIADEAGAVFNYSPVISLVHEDQLWCGGATDSVLADYADGVGADCETAVEGTPKWRKVRVGRTGRVLLSLRCAWHLSVPCTGVARLVAARALPTPPATGSGSIGAASLGPPAGCGALDGRQLGRARFSLRAGRIGKVALTLPARARRLLSRRRCVPVVARFDLKGPDGVPYGASRSLSLVQRTVKTR